MHPDSVQTLSSTPAVAFHGIESDGDAGWPDIAAIERSCPVGRMQLGRIVMLAAETGARFERDGILADPAAWMVAPRRLFGGNSAVEACRDERPFLRAMLLHGLSAGLDADPELVDALVADDPAVAEPGECREIEEPRLPCPRMDLYTATVVCECPESISHIFHACMAFGPDDIVRELRKRVGGDAGRRARVRRGFDPSDPIAVENVSPALGAVLLEVASNASSPLGHGLNILIEHRFQP
ncbi:MAG TPA: hypothetical protein VF605_19590 [Allosphingosinicella sp.]|jgi:hypothetical protein